MNYTKCVNVLIMYKLFQFYNIWVNQYNHIVVEWKKEKNMRLIQSFHYYEGMEGNNMEFKNRSSGAYIFRPRNMFVKNFVTPNTFKVYKGN